MSFDKIIRGYMNSDAATVEQKVAEERTTSSWLRSCSPPPSGCPLASVCCSSRPAGEPRRSRPRTRRGSARRSRATA